MDAASGEFVAEVVTDVTDSVSIDQMRIKPQLELKNRKDRKDRHLKNQINVRQLRIHEMEIAIAEHETAMKTEFDDYKIDVMEEKVLRYKLEIGELRKRAELYGFIVRRC